MPSDALGILAASTAVGTVDAALIHTSLDLKVGTPRRGLFARVVWSGSVSSGGGTAIFNVYHSGTAFGPAGGTLLASGSALPILLGTVAGSLALSGEYFIPVNTSSRYVALQRQAFTGTGGTIVYRGDLVMAAQ